LVNKGVPLITVDCVSRAVWLTGRKICNKT
jgi:hypothetical protein